MEENTDNYTNTITEEIKFLQNKQIDLKLLESQLSSLLNNQGDTLSLMDCINLFTNPELQVLYKEKEFIGDFIKSKFKSNILKNSECIKAYSHGSGMYEFVYDIYRLTIYTQDKTMRVDYINRDIINNLMKEIDKMKWSLLLDFNTAEKQLKSNNKWLGIVQEYTPKLSLWERVLHPIGMIKLFHKYRRIKNENIKLQQEIKDEEKAKLLKEKEFKTLKISKRKEIQSMVDSDYEFLNLIKDDTLYLMRYGYKLDSYLSKDNEIIKEILSNEF